MLDDVGTWGIASFDNDTASDWFFAVEESPDPGAVMAAAIDDAISISEQLETEPCCEAIAAAELCASCAGQTPARLPDHIELWVEVHPHRPAPDEVAQAVQAVRRIREDSALREEWDESADGPHAGWLTGVDDLLARLERSSATGPEPVSA